MSFFDSILTSLLGSSDKQQLLMQVAASLITKNSSGQGGLAGIVQQFKQAGLGDAVQSWVGNGLNQPVTGDQVHQALGADAIQHASEQTGLNASQVAAALAHLLPQLINHATPTGEVPPHHEVQDLLAGLVKSMGNQS